eukprot:Gb_23931 [translate_table: standard]
MVHEVDMEDLTKDETEAEIQPKYLKYRQQSSCAAYLMVVLLYLGIDSLNGVLSSWLWSIRTILFSCQDDAKSLLPSLVLIIKELRRSTRSKGLKVDKNNVDAIEANEGLKIRHMASFVKGDVKCKWKLKLVEAFDLSMLKLAMLMTSKRKWSKAPLVDCYLANVKVDHGNIDMEAVDCQIDNVDLDHIEFEWENLVKWKG